MEAEVLDEVVLQPESRQQDREHQRGLENMDSCVVRRHKYV